MFAACSGNDVYFKYKLIDHATWDRQDILSFHVDSTLLQEQESYDIILELTNMMNYPYKNLVIAYEISLNDSLLLSKTKNIFLTDKYGQWTGSGIYSSFQLSDTLATNMKPIENKSLNIKLGQILVDEKLEGISKVGIRITKALPGR